MELPDEIWQDIFYLVTDHPARREWEHKGPITLRPFEFAYVDAERELADASLKTKMVLSLVCSKWRTLSAKFYFEDIRIRQGALALARRLEQTLSPSSSLSFGLYTRRITIPVNMSGIWHRTLDSNARRILLACPNVQILARRKEHFRPRFPRYRRCKNGSIHDVELKLEHLKRVDWNMARTNLVQSSDYLVMPSFIWTTPSLEVLCLSDRSSDSSERYYELGFPWSLSDRTRVAESTSMRKIHTFFLDCALEDIQGSQFSSLRRLIINHKQSDHSAWATFLHNHGKQLEVVEYLCEGWSQSTFRDIFASCTNLRSFHCDFEWFMFDYFEPLTTSLNLKELKLFLRKSTSKRYFFSIEPVIRRVIRRRIQSISANRVCLPSLNRVELHGGGWTVISDLILTSLSMEAELNQIQLSVNCDHLIYDID